MARLFSLWLTIEAEQSFSDDQLEDDPEGFAGDVMPREDLLADLEEKIRAAVSPYLHVVAIEIEPNEELGKEGEWRH